MFFVIDTQVRISILLPPVFRMRRIRGSAGFPEMSVSKSIIREGVSKSWQMGFEIASGFMFFCPHKKIAKKAAGGLTNPGGIE
jgi:hypothetical protein